MRLMFTWDANSLKGLFKFQLIGNVESEMWFICSDTSIQIITTYRAEVDMNMCEFHELSQFTLLRVHLLFVLW